MTTLIVPAAGHGSRLGTSRPKALVDLAGRPLIDRVISASSGSVERVVVVIRPSQQSFFEEWAAGAEPGLELSWAYQETPTGSLGAVCEGVEAVQDSGHLGSGVVIVWSDQVGVGPGTITALSDAARSSDRVLAVGVCETTELYVWLELDAAGRIARVMRTRDGDVPPASGLADLGAFGMSAPLALDFLSLAEQAVPADSDRELDFTYALPALSARADKTLTPHAADARELLAVNTPADLARARELVGGTR